MSSDNDAGEVTHMARFAAACFAAFGYSLVWSSAASAQPTFNVAAGHDVKISSWVSVNPDCASTGQIVMRITQAPQHGRVSIRNAGIFPNFPSSNVRSICTARRVRGVEAYYRPESGYLGFDAVGLEMISPGGAYRAYTANIQVR